MSSEAVLKRLILHIAMTQVELCQILLCEDAAVGSDSNRNEGAKRSPSRLQLHRDKLWGRVSQEIASMVEQGATAGPKLEPWLKSNPDAEITRATEKEGRRKEVVDILRRLNGGDNIQETRELVGILEGVSAHAIKESLKGRAMWNRNY
jgi:hypothetical protein